MQENRFAKLQKEKESKVETLRTTDFSPLTKIFEKGQSRVI